MADHAPDHVPDGAVVVPPGSDRAGAARGPITRVGLVVHSGRDPSVAMARRLVEGLVRHDVDVVVAAEGDAPEAVGVPVVDAGFTDDVDVVLSVGGDGTFLRAAHRVRDGGVPLLGINLGRLGFLTEVDADMVDDSLPRIVAGEWTVLERDTLDMVATDADGVRVGTGWALNEVSVEKSAREHMLHMDVLVDDERFTKVGADAMIVATSTGSTAYALSAGGPIVSPHLASVLVVPVAPHTLFDRTLVTAPHQRISILVATEQEDAVVSCDGRTPFMVPPGGRVEVTGSDVPVLVARLHARPFPALVRATFRLD
ncbi:NAD(+)/NADH kinase [Salsipaludibacter albus]|uniref:NAD(+)/NADH kinase n=1 Tax=Salsipaludibacter albus TaxID=2849650 RepID=UPI001EE40635|nr:NAD(+)/NADH kinase [Salsipaludibacter albus]MBY5164184.1 NAD(+)/NADH kinase [Salsipaludibacter albus]